MRGEFGVDIDWWPYELYPDGLQEPYAPDPAPPPGKPLTPSRLTLAFAAASLEPVRRERVSSSLAHQAAECAKESGCQDEYIDRVYHAYWKEHADISSPEVLTGLSVGLPIDLDDLRAALSDGRYFPRITRFDADAHENGVYNLPTFWIGGERFAEQPWGRLELALKRQFGEPERQGGVWNAIEFPRAPDSRPYTFINMVTTIDGKIITGDRGEPVQDLGSPVDHATMRQIQESADAVLIGGGAQRSSPKITYPPHLLRFAATRSGDLLYASRFFEDNPAKAVVLAPASATVPPGVNELRSGDTSIDWRHALSEIRSRHGIRRLLVEGGSDINSELLALDVIDELFLTVAPKIKLGKDVPTYADGDPLPRELVQKYELLDSRIAGSEAFLRYRRRR
jgi:riboflavin biosynthesis pyrimidine reductase